MNGTFLSSSIASVAAMLQPIWRDSSSTGGMDVGEDRVLAGELDLHLEEGNLTVEEVVAIEEDDLNITHCDVDEDNDEETEFKNFTQYIHLTDSHDDEDNVGELCEEDEEMKASVPAAQPDVMDHIISPVTPARPRIKLNLTSVNKLHSTEPPCK